ncbi:MAG: NAD dependent epimerase/dehydratase family [Rhodobacteraceae bacterium HLUCCA08]|nr:MAG: NAD dependent epimerase/dehydratase family [Rhodobacteraceae bacterium HLUCCA08]
MSEPGSAVLVAGGAGFPGRHLAAALLARAFVTRPQD